MKPITCLLLLSLSLPFAACTNEQVYNAIQQNRRQDCEMQPQPLQEDCYARFDISYREYMEELEAATESPANPDGNN